MTGTLRAAARGVRRTFGLAPFHAVLREVGRLGVALNTLEALEVFGGDGRGHAMDYATRVKSLEVWEWNRALEGPLRRNLPRATVRICNSFHQVTVTTRRFDLIVVDNARSSWGPLILSASGAPRLTWCEHFEILPALFPLAAPSAVMVVNVLTRDVPACRDGADWAHTFDADHRARRSAFYGTPRPEAISHEDMAAAYQRHAAAHGRRLAWWFAKPRPNGFVDYFVFRLMSALAWCISMASGPPTGRLPSRSQGRS
jgi:hypothetical protein